MVDEETAVEDATNSEDAPRLDAMVHASVIEDMPEKKYHMFISYRVRTDADLAEKLCDKLQGCSILNEQKVRATEFRLRCFLDKQNLTQGQNFKTQFLDGLNGSCLFLPVISMGVLAGMTGLTTESEDNVLLEWETAFEMYEKGQIAIFPILVGEVEVTEKGTFYKRFDSFWLAKDIPDIHVKGSQSRFTAQQIIYEIFKLQGVFINPLDLPDKLNAIVERFSLDIWPRFRESWEEKELLGAEPLYTCVQCLSDFKISENGEGACRFHKSSGYTNFQGWINEILGFTDASERLAEVSAFDYSTDRVREVVSISVGRVKKKVEDRNKLYVFVWTSERRWFYVFSSDEIELVNHSKPIVSITSPSGFSAEVKWIMYNEEVEGVELSCSSKTSKTPSKCRLRFAWPEVNDQNGPRTVSIEYDETPTFGELPLAPSFTYTLPQGRFYKGPIIKLPVGRTRDDSLPIWGEPKCPLRCKVLKTDVQHRTAGDRDIFNASVSILNPSNTDITVVEARAFLKLRVDPEKTAEIDERNDGTDPSVIRLSPTNWVKPSLVEASILTPAAPPPVQPPPPQFRPHQPFRPNAPGTRPGMFVPPPVFVPPRPAEPTKTPLPVMVQANGSVKVDVNVVVKSDGYDGRKLSNGFYDFSWIAFVNGAPVVVDLEFEDIFGRVFGIMIEYPVPTLKLAYPTLTDVLWLFCDHPAMFSRFECRVRVPEPSNEDFKGSKAAYRSSLQVLEIFKGSTTITIGTSVLRQVVHRALRDGLDVVDMTENLFSDNSGSRFQCRADALVDLKRKVVYAIRLEPFIWDDERIISKSVAFITVPPYGDALRDDEGIAIEGTDSAFTPPSADMEIIEDVIAASTGNPQSLTPVPLRRTFTPVESPSPQPPTSSTPAFDATQLLTAIREVVRSEVEDAVRASMQVQMARIKDVVRESVREVLKENEDGEREERLEEVVERFREVVREETGRQTVRIEAAMTATATAAAAVTMRQGRGVEGAAAAAAKKKGFWG
ncbi:hypothetical protein HDU67_005346 [Dinochytrium kinnereticum]|nr:hypothetical protein HDU67_005346 [Dinochytrium kinnereticum]